MNDNKEEKHFYIPNRLLEAMYSSKLSATQLSIIFSVILKTFGENKSHAKLSASQIASQCHLDRINVSKELKKLIDYRVISVVYTDANGIRTLRINESYSEWIKKA